MNLVASGFDFRNPTRRIAHMLVPSAGAVMLVQSSLWVHDQALAMSEKIHRVWNESGEVRRWSLKRNCDFGGGSARVRVVQGWPRCGCRFDACGVGADAVV